MDLAAAVAKMAQAITPGKIIGALSLGFTAVSIGLFIGLGAHGHAGAEHCTDHMKDMLDQISSVSWAAVALTTLAPLAWFGLLMSRRTSGWGLRIAANGFLFSAHFLLPLLAGVALAKTELATRSCSELSDHIPLAVATLVFAVLWPVTTVLLSRMSLDNYPVLSTGSSSSKSDTRMYVLFKVLCGIGFACQVILCVLFGLFGGNFSVHLQDRVDRDCGSGNDARYAMDVAPALASAGGWMGLTVSFLLVLLWPLLVYTREQGQKGRFDWYRPLTAILLSMCIVLQALAAGLIAGTTLEPADGLWDQLGCAGSYPKYQPPAIILLLLLCFHIIVVVLLVRVRTTFTIPASKICDPSVDDETKDSFPALNSNASEIEMAVETPATGGISAHQMLSSIVAKK